MRTASTLFGRLAVVAVLAVLGSACGRGQTVVAGLTVCGDCHPRVPATGAHAAHVSSGALASYGEVGAITAAGPNGFAYTFGCGNCHPLDPRRHQNGRIEVELHDPAAPPGSLKALAATDAAYAQGRCTGAYCHAGGQAWGRNLPTPAWSAPPARLACDACHLAPPGSGAHLTHVGDPDAATLVAWGDTRALADYKPGGGPSYLFGCGSCHPIEAAPHVNGAVDVSLDPAAAPSGALRAENAIDAAFAGGRCAGVYCHSTGQARSVRTYVETPDWYAGGGTLGCGGCHGNPPAYAGGSPGDGANGHLVGYDEFGVLRGHVLSAVWHGRDHHGDGFARDEWEVESSPITCQTCHAGTVDPANVGSISGFYYFDTSGDYALPGVTTPMVCGTCHTGEAGGQPAGKGKVLPLRHVNGKRDVEFDRRETLGSYPGLPDGIPARPYWCYQPDGLGLSDALLNSIDAARQGTGWATPQGAYAAVLSFNLKDATWDPQAKSCSSVLCHLVGQDRVWGDVQLHCNKCHPP